MAGLIGNLRRSGMSEIDQGFGSAPLLCVHFEMLHQIESQMRRESFAVVSIARSADDRPQCAFRCLDDLNPFARSPAVEK